MRYLIISYNIYVAHVSAIKMSKHLLIHQLFRCVDACWLRAACPLNGVTKSFEYPIPKCSDSIEDFGEFSGKIYFISLDARSGYHQIRVRNVDQEKLAFFTPDGKTKTFKVMPFGPKNAPAFYTAMMKFLRGEWIMLFNETKHIISLTDSPTKIVCNDRIIIDDILLFFNHTPTLLHYFSCVSRVFTKYRLSFKLSKCDFLRIGRNMSATI